MNVYLCGMIGSGKTTIGTALAKQLGIRFLDLDQEINARLGYSFHRLVAERRSGSRYSHDVVALYAGATGHLRNIIR